MNPSSGRQRNFAVMFAGYCAFLQLYATQPILPLFEQLFHASKFAVSLTVTSGGFGVAVGAPLAGFLADRWGRKKLIVWSAALLALSTLVTSLAVTLPVLVSLRFFQGLFTPGVFSVTTAYINDEWSPMDAPKALSLYISGTVMGGFSSRALSGLIAAYRPWQDVFVVLGLMGAVGAWGISRWLPLEKKRHDHATVEQGSLWTAMAEHLRNPQLLAAFLVGFCVLFTLVSTFTYITFYLADPPFLLQPAALGSVFVVYLVGAVVTPFTGRAVNRFGNRLTLAFAIAAGVAGVAITLWQSLWTVALGLAITCSGVFLAQTSANSYVGLSARRNRALATGLYGSFYHAGGSFGAAIPAYFWEWGRWPACVAFIASVQIFTVVLALLLWKDSPTTSAAPAEVD